MFKKMLEELAIEVVYLIAERDENEEHEQEEVIRPKKDDTEE